MTDMPPADHDDPMTPLPSPLMPRVSMRSMVVAVTLGAVLFAMLRAGAGWTPLARAAITLIALPTSLLLGCVVLFVIQRTVASIWYVGGEPPPEAASGPNRDGDLPPQIYPPRDPTS